MAQLTYTQRVRSFAETYDGGVSALQAAVEREIELFLEEHPVDKITDIFFHTMSWNGNLNIIMGPLDENTLLIDLVTEDDLNRLTIGEGPLEGKTIVIPGNFTAS